MFRRKAEAEKVAELMRAHVGGVPHCAAGGGYVIDTFPERRGDRYEKRVKVVNTRTGQCWAAWPDEVVCA